MPGPIEAVTEDVWSEAEEAAVSEEEPAEDEPKEEVVEEPEAEEAEAQPEDDQPTEEAAEAGEEEEETPEDPGVLAALAEAVESGWNADEWDGNYQGLPDPVKQVLNPVYKNMERGLHMKFQEVADLKKEYVGKLEGLQKPPQEEQQAKEPPLPTDDMSAEEYNRAFEARQKWLFEQVLNDKVQRGELASGDVTAALETQQVQAERVNAVTSQPDYNDDIGMVMAKIAEDQYWYDQYHGSNEGALALYEYAKSIHTAESTKQAAATKADAAIKRKNNAAKGSVSRPSSTRKSSPAKNFKEMTWDELEAAAIDEHDRQANA